LSFLKKFNRRFLPQKLPNINGLELAAFSQPARIVGGDYFGFLHFNDGTHALAIADVMGKGMPASMLMANLSSILKYNYSGKFQSGGGYGTAQWIVLS